MEIQIRDDRQMKALTGLSQAQFDSLLPVFSDIYQATQHQKYEEGVKSGTRTRKPGGGFKGKLGFDHGIGHSLLLLYDAKAPRGQKSKEFNDLGHNTSNTSISLFYIMTKYFMFISI